jgi:plastocyanin
MRALAVATFVVLAAPGVADAAVTRPVQAFDQPVGFPPVWTPNQLTAQPGDTIRWQFDETGNANAAGASHDIYLVRPGAADEKLGVSYLNPVVEATLDTEGTYTFYCSIHRDSMRGTITVAAGDPTPVIDPGHPWESPAPPVVVESSGPAPLLNSAAPLSVFEGGDTVAPTLRLVGLKTSRRAARVSVDVSEPGTLYARVLRGKVAVSTAHVAVQAGKASLTVRLPKRKARYRLAVWVRDAARLESKWRYKTLRP